MKALIYDNLKGGWENTKGLWLTDVPEPILETGDEEQVIVKMKYAGFCGSDRGIWGRSSFGDMITNSLQKENKTQRIIGHELLGEIIAVGSKVEKMYGLKVGDIVSAESHITCGKCYQCVRGDKNVCADDIIIGISQDGCFAELAKLPAKILWPTDISKIDQRVAAIQEPFGNAVHACTKVDLKNKTVAIFGAGTIGSLCIMIAKGMGATKVIAVDPNLDKLELARELGADEVVQVGVSSGFKHNKKVIDQIKDLTGGVGVDVSMEMAGFNSSVNNATHAVRRGGQVIFFGLKSGDFVFENFEKLVRNGIQMHCIIGREIWRTWETTKKLLEDPATGIQEKIKKYVLKDFKGSIVKFQEFDRDKFVETLNNFSKVVFEF